MFTITVKKSSWLTFKEGLVKRGIRAPLSAIPDEQTSIVTVSWEDGLSQPMQDTLTELASAANSGIPHALYIGIKDELPTLRAYLQLSSPTGAQTVAATKSIIRVLRALIID